MGDPIEHSLSPIMHNTAFKTLNLDCTYQAFRVNIEKLEVAIKGAQALGIKGLNLTVPLKEKALFFIEGDTIAQAIGAINTVVFEENSIKGYNTDGIGAQKALIDAGVQIEKSNILIVGAGGAARAISFQLAINGANIIIINRTAEKAIKIAKDVSQFGNIEGHGIENFKQFIQHADVLINCTTLGMYPRINDTIAKAADMHSNLTVFDIVYNPLKTNLLLEAEKAGAKTISGVMMLVYQGAEAFKIWTGIDPPIKIMANTVLEALKS